MISGNQGSDASLASVRRRHTVRRVLIGAAALALCLLCAVLLEPVRAPGPKPPPAAASEAFKPPPIRHVWVVMLENSRWNCTANAGGGCSPFNSPGYSPYLRDVLAKQGNVLTEYWGIGHNSLDNYTAIISGQAPSPGGQDDCDHFASHPEWEPADAQVDPHGQVIGQGCFYPAKVKSGSVERELMTIAQQLTEKGLTWKGYMEDLGNAPGYDGFGSCPYRNRHSTADMKTDQFVLKHDPFQWFHSITDDPACAPHDVPLYSLARDLQSVRTTPNFSFISPNLVHDGHEASSTPGRWKEQADSWLRQFLPMIMASPAYRQDGLILFTFDESDQLTGVPSTPEDDMHCCNEIPGPNSPMPGIGGPGGGHTGALVLSPFAKPGTRTGASDDQVHEYNHYSALRSFEDLFQFSGGDDGAGHLGFAGTYIDYQGPGSFDGKVYNGYDGTPASPASSPSGGSSGPREPDGSVRWQFPLPQGNDLQGVNCPTTTSCFAVGGDGRILGTADGGDHWTIQPAGTVSDLKAISCPSSQTCTAVGSSGAILVTSDGGHTWATRSSGTATTLNAVSCATAAACVVAGDDGVIRRTDDGGAHWASQDSKTTEPLLGVSCPNATVCYAVGQTGTITATKDGATWALQPTEATKTSPQPVSGTSRLDSISCPSTTTCFAGGDIDLVIRTTDGGAKWTAGFAAGTADTRGRTYLGASCPSVSTCFFVATHNPVTQPAPPTGGGGVTVTKNGGTSYDRQTSGTTNGLKGVSCPTATTCVAVGMRGEIIRTTNGGATAWTSQSPGTDSGLAHVSCESRYLCAFEGLNAINAATCTDLNTCFAVGSYRTVMATSDGGGTWATETSGAPPPSTGGTDIPVPPPALNAISCGGTGRCVAVGNIGDSADSERDGRGSVITTTDGGAHWTDQHSGVKEDLLGVSCSSGINCLAVGGNGTVIHTVDGGGHWSTQKSGSGALLSSISCVDASTCVAVGNFGTILRTTDGGDHWSGTDSGTTTYLAAVSCSSADFCMAVGSSGTVLRITRAGTQVSARPSGVGDELMSVSCASLKHCVATGSLGTVISTADRGDSWAVQGTGTSRALRAASCPTTDRCIAAGDAAAILGVTPTGKPGKGRGKR